MNRLRLFGTFEVANTIMMEMEYNSYRLVELTYRTARQKGGAAAGSFNQPDQFAVGDDCVLPHRDFDGLAQSWALTRHQADSHRHQNRIRFPSNVH